MNKKTAADIINLNLFCAIKKNTKISKIFFLNIEFFPDANLNKNISSKQKYCKTICFYMQKSLAMQQQQQQNCTYWFCVI